MKNITTYISEAIVKGHISKKEVSASREWKAPKYNKGDVCLLIHETKTENKIFLGVIKITQILKLRIKYKYILGTDNNWPKTIDPDCYIPYVQRWLNNPPPSGMYYAASLTPKSRTIIITKDDSYDIFNKISNSKHVDTQQLLFDNTGTSLEVYEKDTSNGFYNITYQPITKERINKIKQLLV